MSIEIPLWLSLAATSAGALQGAVIGRSTRAGLDVIGMLALAVAIGFGGGLARDVLIGDLPPTALRTPWAVIAVLSATLLVLALGRFVVRFASTLVILDAATLGLWAAVGSESAVQAGLPDVAAVLVGTVASVGGGVIASLLMMEKPMVVQPGPPYALAAIAGATAYVLLDELGAGPALVACVVIVSGVRIWTWRAGINTRAVALRPGHDLRDQEP